MLETQPNLLHDGIMQRISAPYSLILLLVLTFAPVTAHSASSQPGADLYRQYCSVCHGPHGAGDGPVADALRVKPTDLTQLAHNRSGKFPELRVMNFIRGEERAVAHGTQQMPIWGRVFLDDSGGRPEIVQMRIYAVMKYVEELQAK
jgi:mono/diheme cytochrome c family protein